MDLVKLYSIAEKSRRLSYNIYSHISVGAALISDKGKIYTGANIEMPTKHNYCCAERIAFYKALTSYDDTWYTFTHIAISSDQSDLFLPCDKCIEYFKELAPSIKLVLLINGKISTFNIKDIIKLRKVSMYYNSIQSFVEKA